VEINAVQKYESDCLMKLQILASMRRDNVIHESISVEAKYDSYIDAIIAYIFSNEMAKSVTQERK